MTIKNNLDKIKDNMTDDEIFDAFAADVIDDCKKAHQDNAQLFIGQKNYSMLEVADEITKRTEFGTAHMRSYYNGLKIIKSPANAKESFWTKIKHILP
jgi:hypothetical protein